MHSESLEKKKIRFKSRTVLDRSVTAINFIMACTVNSGLFAAVCKKMGSDHRKMFLNTLISCLTLETVPTSPF